MIRFCAIWLTSAVVAASGGQSLIHVPHVAVHGGIFADAAGDTLHLEGVWPAQRVFRLYVSDSHGSPLASARMRELRGRVVNGDRDVAPLILSTDATYLEARVEPRQPPTSITIALRASDGAPDERIGLTFARFSVDEVELFAVPPTVIPATLPEIVTLVRIESREARALFDGTSTRGVYVEVSRVRDLALALEPYAARQAPNARTRAETAIRTALRRSWLLHVAADEGLPFQVRLAARMLAEAIDELVAAFDGVHQ